MPIAKELKQKLVLDHLCTVNPVEHQLLKDFLKESVTSTFVELQTSSSLREELKMSPEEVKILLTSDTPFKIFNFVHFSTTYATSLAKYNFNPNETSFALSPFSRSTARTSNSL